MIFGFLNIAEKISHFDAFRRPDLRSKRMGNKMPTGNILVQADGSYNRFDGGVHRHNFERIKQHYAVGCDTKSRMLTSPESTVLLRCLWRPFVPLLVSWTNEPSTSFLARAACWRRDK